MDILLQDFRYAVRTLMRSRAFSSIAILCLALGIGINTAMFSVVHGMLFRALPFDRDGRLMTVYATDARRGIEDAAITYPDLEELRASGVFTAVGGITGRNFTLTATDQPERLEGASITPGLFEMLGVKPLHGRLFRPEEAAVAGFEQVALISHRIWQEWYGADPALVGRPIHVNGRELVVAGIMPAGFRFPERSDIWLPLGIADPTNRGPRFIQALGVLAPGITLEQANLRLHALAARWTTDFPDTHRNWGLNAMSYRDSVIDPNAQRLMYIMLGAVAFVLMIACANVANLLLARAADREREIALRAALGASRKRIVRQLLTESFILALAGGALGVLISIWWVEAMVSTIPEELPFWLRFSVDRTVLLYTLGISLLTGLLFGIAPALQATRPNLQANLRESTRSASDSRGQRRTRSSLVVAEIALSLILLVGASLMVQSFMRLKAADAGFATGHLLTFRVTLAGDRYDPFAAKAEYFRRTAERIAALPGVAAAAATMAIPADDGGYHVPVRAEGDPRPVEEAIIASEIVDGTGLYHALGEELIAGRDFTAHEMGDTTAHVVIVGQQLAQRLWPNQEAVGRRMRLNEGDSLYTVIGVAPNLQYEEFGEETDQDRLQFHTPFATRRARQMAFIVRAAGDPSKLQQSVKDELRRIDPTLAPWDMKTMDERRLFTTWEQRLFGKTFGTFGAAALVLALSGVYGVMAYTVARRRREIGVRIALGAQRSDVLRLVVGGAAALAGLGVAIGLFGAFAVSSLLSGIIWGVSTNDPLTFIATPILLATAALAASYLPARRASRVDPMVALRSE